jgi:hypothetical protein
VADIPRRVSAFFQPRLFKLFETLCSARPAVPHRQDLRLCRAPATGTPLKSALTSANIDKILALKPDLVLTFSDLQANIVADLIRRGLDVHAFNQRNIAGILDMIRTLGAMVDARANGLGSSWGRSKRAWAKSEAA